MKSKLRWLKLRFWLIEGRYYAIRASVRSWWIVLSESKKRIIRISAGLILGYLLAKAFQPPEIKANEDLTRLEEKVKKESSIIYTKENPGDDIKYRVTLKEKLFNNQSKRMHHEIRQIQMTETKILANTRQVLCQNSTSQIVVVQSTQD